MYFCPCPCNDPIDSEPEENAFFSLPRNLSYVQESYLDRYNVSGRFVHNPKIDRCTQHEQRLDLVAEKVKDDENLGLLSAVRAQEFPVRCVGEFSSPQPDHTEFDHCNRHLHLYPDAGGVSDCVGGCGNGRPTFSSGGIGRAGSIEDTSLELGVGVIGSIEGSPGQFRPAGGSSSPSNIAGRVGSLEDTSPALSSSGGRSPSSLTSPLLSTIDSTRSALLNLGSKLGAQLRSPEHAAITLRDRDIGSSVDGDDDERLLVVSREDEQYSILLSPEELGPEMDRGDEELSDPEDSVFSTLSRPRVRIETNDEEMHEVGLGEKGSCDTEPVGENPPVERPFGRGGKTHYPRNKGSKNVPSSTFSTARPVHESPDSDGFSEEGVFLNVDELDSNQDEKSTTVSEVSDDTCVSVDSMFLSPEEGELEEEDQMKEEAEKSPLKMSLQEAISRAASDLDKMSVAIYGENTGTSAASSSREEEETGSDSDRLTLATVGRGSPLRAPPGLKIPLTTEGISENMKTLSASAGDLCESPVYKDDEFNFSRVELRKSSSLKTNKTPPGTPHRKKVVRFADAMGLDLESVRHVLNMESPPKIPASAMADLRAGLNEERKEIGSTYLCACFNQPGASDDFMQKVINKKVCLENAIVTDLTITGFVRVSNIGFHKTSRVRYTHNSWATFHDIAATYVQNSCDGPTDRFSFSIVAPPYFNTGSRLEFAVSYNVGGQEFWDNNNGKNYVFECFAKAIPTEGENAWMHFL